MGARKITKEDFVKAVEESKSVAEALKALNLRPTGGNYKQFEKYTKEYNTNCKHFNGKGWRVGSTKPVKSAQPLEEILVANSKYSTSHLKKRLIKEKILEEKCVNCNLTQWIKDKIPLELDHKNGINNDHRLENLRLLCPNCHAQTDNYRGKNKNRY